MGDIPPEESLLLVLLELAVAADVVATTRVVDGNCRCALLIVVDVDILRRNFLLKIFKKGDR